MVSTDKKKGMKRGFFTWKRTSFGSHGGREPSSFIKLLMSRPVYPVAFGAGKTNLQFLFFLC